MSIGFSMHHVTSASVEVKEAGGPTRWVTLSFITQESDTPVEVTLFVDSDSDCDRVLAGLCQPPG